LIHVNPAQRGGAGNLYGNPSIVVPATLTERAKSPGGLRDASRFDPLSRLRP